MPTKNYKITINTEKDFNRFENDKAIEYLLNNLDKINRNNITVLTEHINWEEQVQVAYSNIWREHDFRNRLDNNIKIDVYKLSFEYAKNWFTKLDADAVLQCLEQLSNKNIDGKDLNTERRTLHKKATKVFAEAIERDINSQIEIEATLPEMPF